MLEPQRLPLAGDEICQRIERLGFVAAPNDEIQVIGSRVPRAEEFEAREPAWRARGHQRRNGDQLVVGPHRDRLEPGAAPEVRPPGVQPFEREKRIVRATRSEEPIPMWPQRRESGQILDALYPRHRSRSGQARGDAGYWHHRTALPPASSDTCFAIYAIWRGVRS